eukprot:704203-Rhodomonas_salina.1
MQLLPHVDGMPVGRNYSRSFLLSSARKTHKQNAFKSPSFSRVNTTSSVLRSSELFGVCTTHRQMTI